MDRKALSVVPPPTPSQVRDYVLTMLEGLASLADSSGDVPTRDRIRDFSDSLIADWAPKSVTLLSRDFGRIDELIAAYAQEQPDATALVVGERSLTYAQLNRRIDRLGAALQREGLVKGDVIAVCSATCLDFVPMFMAASRTGVVIAPMATWLQPDTICSLIADSTAKILFTDLAALAAQSPAPPVMIEALEDWMAPDGARPQPVPIGPEDVDCLIYSSGTTGQPKGVMQTYMSRWRLLTVVGVNHRESYLISTPLYSAVTTFAWSKPLAAGGAAVMMSKFDAGEFLRLSETWRITNTVVVPVQAQRILAHEAFDRTDLSAYKGKVLLGAPSTPELKAEMLRRWPGLLTEAYAMSEGGVASYLDATAHPDKLHTVGKPRPGVTLKVIDDEGHELPQGCIGELIGRSKTMMHGYHNKPEATGKAFWFDAEGLPYIRSGDLGRIDNDGFVELLGRKKDMIVSGGQNVYPSDLEQVLERHPGVLEAAVVGRKSKRWGEEPVAFVTLKSGCKMEPHELYDWMCERIGKHQRPAEVRILEELPRSPVGKVLKRELRALLEAA